MIQFIVNRQIAIEAETPEEAVEKTKQAEGLTISLGVNPRPKSDAKSQGQTSGQFSRTSTKPITISG